jgi:hypothetical protein
MPTHIFVLYGLLPIAAWFTYRRFYRTKRGLIGVMTSAVLLGSALYIAGIHFISTEYRDDLMRYDLNKDGEFSDTEYTPEARAAMERLTRDTGRSMAPIVAPFATSIWTMLMFGVCKLCSLGIVDLRYHRLNKNAEQAAP